MKIYGSTGKIYQNTGIPPTGARNKPAPGTEKSAAQSPRPQRINIPTDFKLKQTLNKQEQKFFETLYPRAQKEIQRYVQNQNNVPVEKGKHIDVRG